MKQRIKPADFPAPWRVIRHGRTVAEFDSEASARLYVEVRRLVEASIERRYRPGTLPLWRPGPDSSYFWRDHELTGASIERSQL